MPSLMGYATTTLSEKRCSANAQRRSMSCSELHNLMQMQMRWISTSMRPPGDPPTLIFRLDATTIVVMIGIATIAAMTSATTTVTAIVTIVTDVVVIDKMTPRGGRAATANKTTSSTPSSPVPTATMTTLTPNSSKVPARLIQKPTTQWGIAEA